MRQHACIRVWGAFAYLGVMLYDAEKIRGRGLGR